jgi:tetratricopeptide (TPR) repeat protein
LLIHFGKADALDILGRDQEGISQYDLVLQLEPNNTSALIGMGNLLYSSGKYIEAIQNYDKVHSTNDYGALFGKANAFTVLGRYEALVLYDILLSRAPCSYISFIAHQQ